jgi:hypothetical protein
VDKLLLEVIPVSILALKFTQKEQSTLAQTKPTTTCRKATKWRSSTSNHLAVEEVVKLI